MIHVAARVAEIKQISLQEVLDQNLAASSQIYNRFFERKVVEEVEEFEEDEEVLNK